MHGGHWKTIQRKKSKNLFFFQFFCIKSGGLVRGYLCLAFCWLRTDEVDEDQVRFAEIGRGLLQSDEVG